MVELKAGDRLILNDSDWKVNVFEVVKASNKASDGVQGVLLKQVKGRM